MDHIFKTKQHGQAPLDVEPLFQQPRVGHFPSSPGIREALKRKRQAMPRQRKDTPLGRSSQDGAPRSIVQLPEKMTELPSGDVK